MGTFSESSLVAVSWAWAICPQALQAARLQQLRSAQRGFLSVSQVLVHCNPVLGWHWALQHLNGLSRRALSTKQDCRKAALGQAEGTSQPPLPATKGRHAGKCLQTGQACCAASAGCSPGLQLPVASGLPHPDVVLVYLGALQQIPFLFPPHCFLNPLELWSTCSVLQQGVVLMSCVVHKKPPSACSEHTTLHLHLAEGNSQASTTHIHLGHA